MTERRGGVNPRRQIICAAAGPAALVVFFVGFALAGFFPPHDPTFTAERIAEIYREDRDQIRLGTFIMVASAGVVTPFAAAVFVQLRRIEGREAPVLSLTQFAAGTAGILLFLTQAMFWSIAAYRPERSPEATQVLNDIAWFFTVMPFCLIVVQALTIAAVILGDERDTGVFPRWLGYLNLWCALLYIPGGTMTFFKDGPLAWNGLLAFWVPASVYLTWFVVMAVHVARAARVQASSSA